MSRGLAQREVLLNAANIVVAEIHHGPATLDQLSSDRQRPAHRAKHCQRHRWSAMHPKRAVNEELRIVLTQGGGSEFHTALKQFRWLGFKIVVHTVVQNFDSMGSSQLTVVELNLHVDDVSYSSAGHLLHVFGALDSPAHRDAIHDPRHIHTVTTPQQQGYKLLVQRMPYES